mmetsp:Transcript_99454/g.281510  ORF Transcript_99454/g.281510 Transcript_99454/m.281510 type:complete len:226 (-) Transcript_99454:659-1336(-)
MTPGNSLMVSKRARAGITMYCTSVCARTEAARGMWAPSRLQSPTSAPGPSLPISTAPTLPPSPTIFSTTATPSSISTKASPSPVSPPSPSATKISPASACLSVDISAIRQITSGGVPKKTREHLLTMVLKMSQSLREFSCSEASEARSWFPRAVLSPNAKPMVWIRPYGTRAMVAPPSSKSSRSATWDPSPVSGMAPSGAPAMERGSQPLRGGGTALAEAFGQRL